MTDHIEDEIGAGFFHSIIPRPSMAAGGLWKKLTKKTAESCDFFG